jgi:biopolymer transport protein ExbD
MGETTDNAGARKSKGKARAKKHSAKIDMTPMVDLAFLLLTFFILTTTLAEQKEIDLVMPSDSKPDPVNNAVNIILTGDDKIFYYTGELRADTKLSESNFKNIRKIIQKKNQKVIDNIELYKMKHKGGDFIEDSVHIKAILKIQKDAQGAVVVIKYDSLAKYRNTIDMVDEMEVCGVPSGRYAIVKKLEAAEKALLRDAKKK